MSDEIETIESNPKSWGAWKREAERLQKIIDDAANREAQPVAYLKKSIIDSERFDSADPEIILHPNTPEGWHSEYQAVFTTPSAPAVPEDIPESVYTILSSACGDSACLVADDLWNACRAAMLAQPVSQGYKLPPHAYRELVNSLRDTAVKYSGTDQLREHLSTALSQFIEPDHHHTRTGAPDRN
ncbi:Uncharacterised protein [Serratia grimesii]|uniref:hypothetical protein n=1 Tax=Serratia grimesii TaxID=82995 RepID=UPI00217BC4A9|nr:hypothetical protein [Serratia grimesii]CAI1598452.1 Uncharacterised protein [Serratia grimesii]